MEKHETIRKYNFTRIILYDQEKKEWPIEADGKCRTRLPFLGWHLWNPKGCWDCYLESRYAAKKNNELGNIPKLFQYKRLKIWSYGQRDGKWMTHVVQRCRKRTCDLGSLDQRPTDLEEAFARISGRRCEHGEGERELRLPLPDVSPHRRALREKIGNMRTFLVPSMERQQWHERCSHLTLPEDKSKPLNWKSKSLRLLL